MRAVVYIAIAFLLAIGAFVGSTLLLQRVARVINQDVLEISRDAAPGVEAVASLRAEMRLLEGLVVRRTSGGPPADDEIDGARRRLDGMMAKALDLPASHEESKLVAELERTLRAFDASVERALTQVRAGKLVAARASVDDDLRGKADDADRAATALVDYDARAAQAAAERIEDRQVYMRRLAWQLDSLSAILGLTAAFFAFRALRQFQNAQARYLKLAERKAAELEQFAGRVAHDVLSPLATVGLSLSLAGRTASAQTKDALARGEAALQRVRGIVDGLLDFARSGASPDPLSRTEVAPVVAGLREELLPAAAQYDAELEIADAPACAVACEPGVLMSLLGNLLRNAIKYLGACTERRVMLVVEPRRDRVLFEVHDTGPGVPVELRDRIFESYVRGNHPGTPGIGLGLATVKRLVQAHGGSLGLRPATGGGTVFWFELPAAEAASRDEAARSA